MRSRQQKAQGYETPPDVVLIAAELMVGHLPESDRPAAMRVLAEGQRTVCEQKKHPIPEWVAMLANLADETEKPKAQK